MNEVGSFRDYLQWAPNMNHGIGEALFSLTVAAHTGGMPVVTGSDSCPVCLVTCYQDWYHTSIYFCFQIFKGGVYKGKI